MMDSVTILKGLAQNISLFLTLAFLYGLSFRAAQTICARYDIPIIFITGYSEPKIVARAQALNPVAFLEKPLLLPQIEAAIKAALLKKP